MELIWQLISGGTFISALTLGVNWQIQRRKIQLEEFKHLTTLLEVVKEKNKIDQQIETATFFSIMTSSRKLKKSWKEYLKNVLEKKRMRDREEVDSIQKLSKEILDKATDPNSIDIEEVGKKDFDYLKFSLLQKRMYNYIEKPIQLTSEEAVEIRKLQFFYKYLRNTARDFADLSKIPSYEFSLTQIPEFKNFNNYPTFIQADINNWKRKVKFLEAEFSSSQQKNRKESFPGSKFSITAALMHTKILLTKLLALYKLENDSEEEAGDEN